MTDFPTLLSKDDDDEESLTDEMIEEFIEAEEKRIPFESVYQPDEMRCLTMVAHNHMKPALKKFVPMYHQLLRKFLLTGTDLTMRIVKSVIGDDSDIKYGPTY